MTTKSPINWTITLFFILVPLIAILGTVLLCVFGIVHWPTWVLAGSYMVITGLAITAGYHRLFSHKSYKAAWPVRLILLLFSAAAFEGSALEWCTDHRNHHRYTDTEKDPYSINKGFWYAHMGWLFRLDASKRDFSNVEDLSADRLIRWQHKYYLVIAIFMGFIFPLAIAALWGDPLGGLIIAGALRMTLNHHFTFAVNSVCHYFGKKTYSDKQSARDNWVTAFFTYGEGFHNFHHQFPLDYRNGVRNYHFDPAKWIIKSWSWFGLAWDLKRVSDHRIIRYRLQVEERSLMDKLALVQTSMLNQLLKVVEPVRESVQQALAKIEMLEKEYLEMRKQKLEVVYAKMDEYKQRLKVYKKHLKTARLELHGYLLVWSRVLSNCKLFISLAVIPAGSRNPVHKDVKV